MMLADDAPTLRLHPASGPIPDPASESGPTTVQTSGVEPLLFGLSLAAALPPTAILFPPGSSLPVIRSDPHPILGPADGAGRTGAARARGAGPAHGEPGRLTRSVPGHRRWLGAGFARRGDAPADGRRHRRSHGCLPLGAGVRGPAAVRWGVAVPQPHRGRCPPGGLRRHHRAGRLAVRRAPDDGERDQPGRRRLGDRSRERHRPGARASPLLATSTRETHDPLPPAGPRGSRGWSTIRGAIPIV